MRKTILKTILLIGVASVAVIHSGRSNAQERVCIEQRAEWKHTVSRLFGLNLAQNFKAYHVASHFFFAGHCMPSVQDMFDAIYSHPAFQGTRGLEEGAALLASSGQPYVLFQEKGSEENSFYVAHERGMRHFSVEGIQVAGSIGGALLNLQAGKYPTLSSFLRCTLR